MHIYKQYDQAALDRQYNNRLQVPDYLFYMQRWESLSRQTEKEFPVIKDIAYGESSREKMDIYPSPLPQSKTLIFIHGGYWQRLDKSDFQFIAREFHKYNITTVIITYPLAPFVAMDQIVASCYKAVQWVSANIYQYNGDAEQIYVAGHSAGAHLASMLITIDMNSHNLKPNSIKGICALSGLYNLTPIWLSDINDVLKMDKEMALRNSPAQLNVQSQCPFIIAVGSDESSEFKEQSRELYSAWKSKMSSIQLFEIPELNHYSILETIIEPTAILNHAVHKLLKIEK